jgi:hypothetical protein
MDGKTSLIIMRCLLDGCPLGVKHPDKAVVLEVEMVVRLGRVGMGLMTFAAPATSR